MIAALLLLSASVAAPAVPRAPVEVPEAVLAHPAADPSLQAEPPRWSPQALAKWGGPWEMEMRPGHYDHRYVTW